MILRRLFPISTHDRAPGEKFSMHQHGPDEPIGPIRGTAAWWRGMGARPDDPDEGPPVTLRRKNRKRPAGIRTDLVERVRAEIAAGTYDTPEKWQAALDRLLERLDGA